MLNVLTIGLLALISCTVAEVCNLGGVANTLDCQHLSCGAGMTTGCVQNICECVPVTTVAPAVTTTAAPVPTTAHSGGCVFAADCHGKVHNCDQSRIHCQDTKCYCQYDHNSGHGCEHNIQCHGHVDDCSDDNSRCWNSKCYCRRSWGGVGR